MITTTCYNQPLSLPLHATACCETLINFIVVSLFSSLFSSIVFLCRSITYTYLFRIKPGPHYDTSISARRKQKNEIKRTPRNVDIKYAYKHKHKTKHRGKPSDI